MNAIQVLDHGYVGLISHMGSDETIVEAARMSTGKGFQGWGEPPHWSCSRCGATGPSLPLPRFGNCHHPVPMEWMAQGTGDEKLLAYLWNNRHTTPFEQCAVTFEVKAPIFVFREWHRHRTQSYNEMSARYIPMPDENYLPALEGMVERATTATTNKQAAPVATVDGAAATPDQLRGSFGDWLAGLDRLYREAERVYQDGLLRGVPKELARLAVPVARYSRMRASANLLNWLRFLSLRNAPAAQWEIRQYAAEIERILATLYPRTLALFRAKAL